MIYSRDAPSTKHLQPEFYLPPASLERPKERFGWSDVMNEPRITYEGVRTELLSKFPEFLEPMKTTFGSYYDMQTEVPEAYPLFEDVVQICVLELLRSNGNQPLLERLFGFFEEMACSFDPRVTDLLGIAILEPLESEPELAQRALPYMGQKTRQLTNITKNS